MDKDGDVLDILVQSRRNRRAAVRFFRKLLVDRVVFTPRTDHYEFVGPWTLGKLVSGVVDLPQGMASLSTPSWNQFMVWLREMAELWKSGVVAA